ncbi:MAG TPA: (Fe-S)-binding protein [Niabella sp.]|jgi:L-lactate dehydrogenase complex protein LldE|nr:(Fe-S)-binding protein [Chitinophagaceae bacterium]HRO84828.1 (Fe-S)-binding protein [Niabella sp.]
MDVQIFIPCFVDQLYPETAFNMIKVLEKFGCNVQYNTQQTCCGQPAFNAGFWEDAKPVCSKFINEFKNAQYVVAPSASCIGFVRNYYPKLFENSSLHNDLKKLSAKTFEFTEFLLKVLNVKDTGATFKEVITYHDSCAALRECKIKQGPRILLENVKGLTLRELADNETCCGFGGTFAVKFNGISVNMGEQKVENAIATGANYIVSTDLSCLMHLQGYIDGKGYSIKTMHIADVLASGW